MGQKKNTHRYTHSGSGSRQAIQERRNYIEAEVRGIKLRVNADSMSDFEYIDALDQLDSGENPLRLAKIVRTITGDKYKEVMDTLRRPDRIVHVEDVADFVREFFEKISAESPNSQRSSSH